MFSRSMERLDPLGCCTRMGIWATTGMVSGALAGFAISVWLAHDVLEPELAKTQGINSAGAKGLTALIWLGGGGETCIALGILSGAFAFSVLGCCFESTSVAISSALERCSGFFRRDINHQTTANIPTDEPSIA